MVPEWLDSGRLACVHGQSDCDVCDAIASEPDIETWRTRDGRWVKIVDMDDAHLVNARAIVRRSMKRKDRGPALLLRSLENECAKRERAYGALLPGRALPQGPVVDLARSPTPPEERPRPSRWATILDESED